MAQPASKLKKYCLHKTVEVWSINWHHEIFCFRFASGACLFISWECPGKIEISCRAMLIAVSAKGNCPPQSNYLMMYQSGTNQIVLSPIAQDSSEKPCQFQKLILRGSSSSSLYNQSYFLPSLSTAMENSCLKCFWSVSHSQRLFLKGLIWDDHWTNSLEREQIRVKLARGEVRDVLSCHK